MEQEKQRDSENHKPGQRLATLTRKQGAEQFRIELREYQGHRYLDLRVWWQNEDGDWKPGKGCTVKLHEVVEVRDALSEAINLTGPQNRRRVVGA